MRVDDQKVWDHSNEAREDHSHHLTGALHIPGQSHKIPVWRCLT